jgi:hypothetical protein
LPSLYVSLTNCFQLQNCNAKNLNTYSLKVVVEVVNCDCDINNSNKCWGWAHLTLCR